MKRWKLCQHSQINYCVKIALLCSGRSAGLQVQHSIWHTVLLWWGEHNSTTFKRRHLLEQYMRSTTFNNYLGSFGNRQRAMRQNVELIVILIENLPWNRVNCCIVSIWNSLPDYVVSACPVKIFENYGLFLERPRVLAWMEGQFVRYRKLKFSLMLFEFLK